MHGFGQKGDKGRQLLEQKMLFSADYKSLQKNIQQDNAKCEINTV